MALESATYINQLVATNPLGSDPIASGDDHIRLIKAALQATFPNITGPVTPTQAVLNNPFPVGGIILWSGSIVSVPAGWALCDGTNGTPNLRDRFVVGAGSAYAVGATGGSADAAVVAHTHTFTATSGTESAGHTHSISLTTSNVGDHQHVIGISGGQGSVNLGNSLVGDPGQRQTTTRYTEGAGAHTHTVSGTSAGVSANHTHTVSGTSDSTGSSATNANLPPYYALAYIMKV